jgi:hypothetical protein
LTRREVIFGTIEDLVTDFLYYDRKEDEELPVGAIEEAVAAGEITAEEMTAKFAAVLGGSLSPF